MEKTTSTCIHHAASTLQAGGVMVWGVFSLGPLIKVEQRLNAAGYLHLHLSHLNIIANQVHLFMAAVYRSVNECFSAG
jgi:exosortase/archaeosortase